MKRILGVTIAILAGIAASMPAAATGEIVPEPRNVPVVTSAGEDESNKADKIEVPPTFKFENLESEESIRLWAGKNLLVAGNNIETSIEAPNGLMLMAGNNLDLGGLSEYGFAFGNNINFSGSTIRDLFLAGNNITLQKEAQIGRDVYSSSARLNVFANITGSLSAVAANVELKDIEIAGNLNLTADNIKITGKVKVNGAFTYNDNANIQGLENLSASRTETFHVEEINQATIVLTRIYSKVMSVAALFLAMAIISFFCPKLHDKVKRIDSVDRFGNVLVKGLGVFIAFPLAAILAFLTYVAAPLGIIAILLYIVLIYISQGFAGLWLGHIIAEKLIKTKVHVLLEVLFGIVILGILALIPYVGTLTGFVGMFLGLGLIFDQIRPRKSQTDETATEKIQEAETAE